MHRALRGFLEPAYLWRHLLIWLCVAFAVGPILWVISGSFDPANTIIGQRLIPREPSLANYHELFTNPQHPFALWMWNTVKISLITAFFVVSITSFAAYAFSRFEFYGRRTGLFAILLYEHGPENDPVLSTQSSTQPALLRPEHTTAGHSVMTRLMRGILFGCPRESLSGPSFISQLGSYRGSLLDREVLQRNRSGQRSYSFP